MITLTIITKVKFMKTTNKQKKRMITKMKTQWSIYSMCKRPFNFLSLISLPNSANGMMKLPIHFSHIIYVSKNKGNQKRKLYAKQSKRRNNVKVLNHVNGYRVDLASECAQKLTVLLKNQKKIAKKTNIVNGIRDTFKCNTLNAKTKLIRK